jgi:CRISPR/Cas system CSM-associated protein Csm3 (group 7 of RAMP superfamily)
MNDSIRVRIHGVLEVKSPLHIGSGERDSLLRHEADAPPNREEDGEFDALCLTEDHKPYLPATSLRGFLRAQLGNANPLTKRLFGYVEDTPSGEDGGKRAWAGKLRVFNALLQDDPALSQQVGIAGNRYWQRGGLIRQNVALDPVTLTADEHKLFSYEYLPTGSRFELLLELDDATKPDIAHLLGLLNAWDGGIGSGLGRGSSRLQGRLQWELSKVEVLTQAKLAQWLTSDEPLEQAFAVLKATPIPTRFADQAPKPIAFRIHAESLLLVNDQGQTKRRDKEGGKTENDQSPNLEYSRDPQGCPVLPAASLKGAVRARARKILLTLLAEQCPSLAQATQKAESMVQQLFGQEDRRSLLWIGDAVLLATDKAEHLQHFNAIDRFTGGVATGKLYSVNAQDSGVYAGQLALDPAKLEDWARGLLILVVRDAIEGDIALGWGKARGYGAFRLALSWQAGHWIDHWPDLLAALGKAEAQRNIDALHQAIRTTAADPA